MMLIINNKSVLLNLPEPRQPFCPIKVCLAAAASAGYQVIINCLILFRNGIFYRKEKELGFCCKKSGYFTKPVKNITNGIFICHKQVNNDTKSNSYSLKRQYNYFCNRTVLKGLN